MRAMLESDGNVVKLIADVKKPKRGEMRGNSGDISICEGSSRTILPELE